MSDFVTAVRNFGTNTPKSKTEYRARLPTAADMGSAAHWERRFQGRSALPDGALELLQALSRAEYNDEDVAAAREAMLEAQRIEGEALMVEWAARTAEESRAVLYQSPTAEPSGAHGVVG